MNYKILIGSMIVLATPLLAGCAVSTVHGQQTLNGSARWVQLPIANYAEAPHAGDRAAAILDTMLHNHGVQQIKSAPSQNNNSGLPNFDPQKSYQQALQWARQNGYQYGVTGSVEEWQYKTGLDGEPAVGISLRVVNVNSGATVWSASGSKAGWGYSTLSGTAQKLISSLVDGMSVKRAKTS